MNEDQIIQELQNRKMDQLLELVEDAKTKELEELELVESIGLVYDKELNDAIIRLLNDYGVTIIYVEDDED